MVSTVKYSRVGFWKRGTVGRVGKYLSCCHNESLLCMAAAKDALHWIGEPTADAELSDSNKKVQVHEYFGSQVAESRKTHLREKSGRQLQSQSGCEYSY